MFFIGFFHSNFTYIWLSFYFSNSSSILGPKSAGVPGEIKGYWEAKSRFGNPDISWSELLQPTIDICNNGNQQFKDSIVINEIIQGLKLQDMQQMHWEDLQNTSWKTLDLNQVDILYLMLLAKNHLYFTVFVDKKTGEVFKEGDIYKHPKMAETLQRISDNGADEFYSGEVARNLVKDISVAGGIITKEA